MSDVAQSPVAAQLTLKEAMDEYIASLKPELRQVQGAFVRKYVEHAGEQFPVAGLTGSRVESYVEKEIKPSDPNAPERVAALKAWFQFLRKKNYSQANFGVHVRVRRPASRGGAGVRVEAPPLEMTAEGIAALKKELDELTELRSQIVRAIATAREDGDLRENAPYHAAREALGMNESRREQVEQALKRAVVVDRATNDRSALGSKVTVIRLDTEQSYTYTLVGAREADSAQLRISVESPVGKALLGHRVGEVVVVAAPRHQVEYRIEAVSQTG